MRQWVQSFDDAAGLNRGRPDALAHTQRLKSGRPNLAYCWGERGRPRCRGIVIVPRGRVRSRMDSRRPPTRSPPPRTQRTQPRNRVPPRQASRGCSRRCSRAAARHARPRARCEPRASLIQRHQEAADVGRRRPQVCGVTADLGEKPLRLDRIAFEQRHERRGREGRYEDLRVGQLPRTIDDVVDDARRLGGVPPPR